MRITCRANFEPERHCIAYWWDKSKEYHIDLYQFGVRGTTHPDVIWDVAKREMMLQYGKPVSAWQFVSIT